LLGSGCHAVNTSDGMIAGWVCPAGVGVLKHSFGGDKSLIDAFFEVIPALLERVAEIVEFQTGCFGQPEHLIHNHSGDLLRLVLNGRGGVKRTGKEIPLEMNHLLCNFL
jgi:hypothetical protein